MVSIAHALFCIVSTSYYFAVGNPTNTDIVCGGSLTELEYSIIVVSTGYLIYDLFGMAYLGLLDKDGIFHHGVCVLITFQLIRLDQGCNFWVGVLFMSEVSIPFMHCRLILRQMGLSKTKAYYFFEDCYFALYFIGRVLIGSVLIWNCMICDKIYPLLKIVGFPLEIRSIYFIFQMAQRVQSRRAFFNDLAKNKIALSWFKPLDKRQIEKCESLRDAG